MATPTLVQYVKFGGVPNHVTLKNWPLPNAVLSGNAVIVFLTCANGQTPTVSDDQSNTYTVVQNTNDAGNSQRALCAYKLNCTNGPTKVTVTFTGGGIGYCTGIVTEWMNIATASAVDVNSGTTFSSTSGAPGSVTTTATDDLVMTYIVEDSVDAFVTNQVMTSWTVPTNFTLLAADRWAGDACAYRIQAATGATNPSWTLSPSRACIVLQVAFKNATAGTAPTATPRIVGVFHMGLDYNGSHASPFVVQAPFSGQGDALYMGYIGLLDPGTVTDSQSNGWTASGASVVNTSGGNSGHVRGYYALAPTFNTNAMTVSIAFTGSGASPGDTAIFYECVGISTFDVHASGTIASPGGTTYSPGPITPTKSDGLVFTTVGEDDNTTLSVNTGVFIAATDPNEEFSPWANDENNAWAYYNNPDTSAFQPTFTTDIAPGPLAWVMDALGPPSAVNKPKMLTMMGVS